MAHASPKGTYTRPQIALHWLTALALLALVSSGFYMVRRYLATSNDATTVAIYEVHKLVGLAVLCMTAVRLALRTSRTAPGLPDSMAAWQRRLARATHLSLYVLLIIVPVLGWLGASADGSLGLPFGLRLPQLLRQDDDLGWRILWWHGWAAISLTLLVLVHAAAALKHLLIDRDGIFQRMWR